MHLQRFVAGHYQRRGTDVRRFRPYREIAGEDKSHWRPYPYPFRLTFSGKALSFYEIIKIYFYIAQNYLCMSDDKKTTTIRIDKGLHKELKKKALNEDKKLETVVEEVVKKGLEAEKKAS